MSIFALRANEKHLHRLYRQADELYKLQHETAEQLDKLAAEIEQTRVVIGILRMDRNVAPSAPLKMEIV